MLLLGHLDVVEAKRADWTRDPFTLIEENGYFYGRGTSDMKAMRRHLGRHPDPLQDRAATTPSAPSSWR